MSVDHLAPDRGRPINGRSWTGDLNAGAAVASFQCVVLFSAMGLLLSAVLQLALSAETIAAIYAALAI
jgi:hypothetical protein